MSLTKVDRSIAVVNFILKKKRLRIQDIESKLERSEAQKIFIGEETELIQNVDILTKAVKQDFNNHLGRQAPQAVDLEEAILGAIILGGYIGGKKNEEGKIEGGQQIVDVLKKYLKPEHFYLETHKLIYSACLDLGTTPLDIRTLINQLRENGHLEQVGGAYYIAELTAKVSSGANVEYHSRMIMEFAIKRRLITMAGKLMMDGYEDSADCFELLDFAESQVNEIKSWIK